MLQTYLIFPMYDTYPTHFVLFDLINAQAVQIFMLQFCSVCTTFCYFLSITCKWLECSLLFKHSLSILYHERTTDTINSQ